MAPEVAATDGSKTQKYNASADVFSLAMVYYFVWERVLPGIPECGKPSLHLGALNAGCLLYTSPSPRDQRGPRMPSSA